MYVSVSLHLLQPVFCSSFSWLFVNLVWPQPRSSAPRFLEGTAKLFRSLFMVNIDSLKQLFAGCLRWQMFNILKYLIYLYCCFLLLHWTILIFILNSSEASSVCWAAKGGVPALIQTICTYLLPISLVNTVWSACQTLTINNSDLEIGASTNTCALEAAAPPHDHLAKSEHKS